MDDEEPQFMKSQGQNLSAWLLVLCAGFAISTPAYGSGDSLDPWHRTAPMLWEDSLRISFGSGIFVAVGESGEIYISPDGIDWKPAGSENTHPLHDSIYGKDTFVAVGERGTVLTSLDGNLWMPRITGTHSSLKGIAYGRGTFVAVGENGSILTSKDGVTWRKRLSNTAADLKKIAFGNQAFVAVGANGAIVTSSDGILWKTGSPVNGDTLEGIAYGKSMFVAVGEKVFMSPEGVTWISKDLKTNHRLLGVAYGAGVFVAVAEDGSILTSSDTSEWIPWNSGVKTPLLAIAYGRASFVASGEKGTLLKSQDISSPQISVSPASLDFGSVVVGSSFAQNVAVLNAGTADLNIQRLSFSGSNVVDFIAQNDGCTGTFLHAGQDCTFQVVFSPHSTGSKAATLTISSNDPDSPTKSIPLSGAGTGSGISFTSGGSGSSCFISTSLSGSGLEPYLDLLRKFRDAFLLESSAGRRLVVYYYQNSPAWADFIARHDHLKGVVRWAFAPVFAFSYAALHTSPAEKAFLLILMTGLGSAVILQLHTDRKI